MATGRWYLLIISLLVGWGVSPTTVGRVASAEPVVVGQAEVLPLDEVRQGMKGYGLTVFQGTKIEPFPVEVLSVMRDFGPQRGVVWIRCTDERMQKLGPVSGMSGSPIYLWSEGEPQELGRGGKLIGAFAYGFGAATDCVVGVQPIELMREVANRARSDRAGGGQRGGQGAGGSPGAMIQSLLDQAQRQGVGDAGTWRLRAMSRLLDIGESAARDVGGAEGGSPRTTFCTTPGMLRSLGVPLTVGSQELANWAGPLLEPLGLVAVAAGGTSTPAGHPPPGVDPKAVRFEPGGVLSIPMAYGDLDLSAVGTVTDVLPNGQVMAFGHALFAEGPTAVPMATGYVHLIVPTLFGSFKLGGSAMIHGAITRDENSAVVGRPGEAFESAPLHVRVTVPGFAEREYSYHVVQHRMLTPVVAGIVAAESVTAEAGLPRENTLHLTGKMRFTDGRSLELDSLVAGGSGLAVMLEVFPGISMMIQNPYEPVALESMEVRVGVEPALRSGQLVNAKLDQEEVEPGDTIGITVQIQPYRQLPVEHRFEVTVPESAAPGEYNLILCDAGEYVDLLMDTHPHVLTTHNVEEYQAVIQRLLSVPADALNIVLQMPNPGLAVGRQEMPSLPSSRRAILEAPASSFATSYQEWIEKTVPMGMVVNGSMQFSVHVK